MFSRRIYLVQLLLACFCASTLSSVLFLPHAFAATNANPITVTAQTVTETFPKGIDFQITIQDTAGTVSQATLAIASNKPHYMQVARRVTIDTQQATETLKWHEDTTGDGFLFPGTVLNYKWELYDSNGNSYVQQAQPFTVLDNRFDWQLLKQGQIDVHWYGQSSDFGQIVLSQAIDNVKRISGNLGGTLLRPINLWIYQTPEDFRGALSPGVHEWVGGIAFPSLNEASIVVDSVNAETLIRDMPHELTHLIFHQLTEQGILAPLWFDEGMAVYNQTYHEPDMKQVFKAALASHKLFRLNTITYDFPASSDAAELAYAQSWNIVSYMYTTFGQEKMAKLIALMNSTNGEFGVDIKQALGEDQVHLENQWRIQLNQSSVLTSADMVPVTPQSATPTFPQQSSTDFTTPLLLLAGVLLIILPIAGFWGVVAYQRRNRQKALTLQQAQTILNTTFRPYGAEGPQPYQQGQPYIQQQWPASPFAAYGDTAIPPMPYVDPTKAYTDPARYAGQQPPVPNQGYVQYGPSKQAPQE